eukprot:577376-Rhodomonas_salina.2
MMPYIVPQTGRARRCKEEKEKAASALGARCSHPISHVSHIACQHRLGRSAWNRQITAQVTEPFSTRTTLPPHTAVSRVHRYSSNKTANRGSRPIFDPLDHCQTAVENRGLEPALQVVDRHLVATQHLSEPESSQQNAQGNKRENDTSKPFAFLRSSLRLEYMRAERSRLTTARRLLCRSATCGAMMATARQERARWSRVHARHTTGDCGEWRVESGEWRVDKSTERHSRCCVLCGGGSHRHPHASPVAVIDIHMPR